MSEHHTPLGSLPPKERRAAFIQATALLIIPVATVILLVLAAAVGVAWWDTRQYAEDNRDHIQRLAAVERAQDRQGMEFRARLKRTDVLNCREIERLKARVRADARESFRELPRTARILRLPLTEELLAVARQERNETLERYKAREGGCGTLPSVRDPS